ncbi:MAG: AAA family ATPase [Candidatus Aminicenantes bacterium]|nr:AAA family ATPase [Candidatus Aminicenantes bacterium]
MWIKEIHIDGFGIFKDLDIKDLSSGLNVFSGMNESGKSTLLEFIRRMLFGFPDRRTHRNPYPALSGGRHGGRLILQSNSGKSFTIERFSEGPEKEAVIDSQGIRMETTEFIHLVGHVNERIYTNVYAFGLSELQDFKTLNSEEVKDRLYSAGTGTGGRAISELIRSLDKERGELYLLQGSKPEINLLFKQIREIDLKLKEIMGNVEKFDHLHEELTKLSKTIAETELKRIHLTKSMNHTKNLLSAWKDWRRLRDSEDRLSKLPDITSFPDKGKEMLDLNASLIRDIDEEIAKRSEELEKNNFQISQLDVNDKIISLKDKILAVQKGEGKFRSELEDLPVLLEQQKILQSAEVKSLKEIGSDWTADKALKFDISIPVKEKVRGKQQEMQNMKDLIQDMEREKKSFETQVEKIRQDHKERLEKMKDLKQPDIQEEELLNRRSALKALRIKLPRLMGLEADLHSFKRAGMWKTSVFPKELIVALFILMLSISGYFVFSAFQKSLKAGTGILSALILFTVIYYIFSRKKSLPESAEKTGSRFDEDGIYSSSGQVLDIHQLREKVKSIRGEILKEAEKCGFDRIPTPELMEELDIDLQGKIEAIHSYNEKQREIKKLENELNQLKSEHEKVEQQSKKLRQDHMSIQEDWDSWLIDSGLDKGLSPEGVMEIFTSIKAVQEQLKNIDSHEEKLRKTESSIKRYEKEVNDLIKAAGVDTSTEKNNVLIKMEKLASGLDQALKNKRDLDHLKLDQEKLKIELKNLRRKKAEKEKAVDLLMKQAGVNSEQEFREMAEFWEERSRLDQEILQCRENIKRFSGEGESYSRFLQELVEAEPEALEAEREKLEAALKDIDEEWDDLKESRGRLNIQIEQLKQEEESSRLRMSYELKLEELRDRSDLWTVLTLARFVLKKAVENYEKERQPEVVKEAQRFFSLMTLGAYSRIYAPLDENPIFVETKKDNIRREIQELSRGTAEQLYLSLRFGFIQEVSHRSESLPVIFDDILVNFDPKRGEAACRAVKELAQEHQVIFFTCHPETVRMFNAYKPDVKFLSIGK